MGGTSSSQQQQQTVSQPWAPAQPGLNSLLSALNPAIGNAGLNPTETSAFNQLLGNAAGGDPYNLGIQSFINSALGGGGATAQAPAVQQALSTYQGQLSPWANNIGDPTQNPALRSMLDTIQADTTNSINQQFAGAGRDLSGLNQQAIARGLAQGEAPTILNAQQQGLQAAGNLYNAANNTAGILGGMQQQSLANQGTGLANSQAGLDALNYTPQQTLNLENLMRNLPVSNLAQIAQLLVPIAGLGGQTNSTASGTQQMSGAQQFGLIASGLNNLVNPLKWLSDRRAKREIEKIGELPNGLNVYEFEYLGWDGKRVGLMADEVEKIHPEAVMQTLLYSMVDYDRAVL